MTTYTIKTNISIHNIWDKFVEYDRANNFSFDGLTAIMDNLEEMVGEDEAIDFDVIAICCDYTESGIREFISDYGLDESDFNYDDVIDSEMVLEWANDNTWAVLLENGNILYSNF